VRVEVQARAEFGEQTRAYAEYRVFSALRSFSDVVRHVSLSLARDERQGSDAEGVICRATLAMTNGGSVETFARGRHACAAIDALANRTRALIARQPSAVA
jgi:hypothetical protein